MITKKNYAFGDDEEIQLWGIHTQQMSKDFDTRYKSCQSHLVENTGCFSYNKSEREVQWYGARYWK